MVPKWIEKSSQTGWTNAFTIETKLLHSRTIVDRRILGNLSESWVIAPNPGESQRILANISESWGIAANPGLGNLSESWGISANPG